MDPKEYKIQDKKMKLEFRKAKTGDFDSLADIRVRAMKPSLERVGRFDPHRAVERLRKSFTPESTIVAVKSKRIVGFYTLLTKNEELYLNHLYIDPDFHCLGIGRALMERILKVANDSSKEITLEALKESEANEFYRKFGFVRVGESEYDNIYTKSFKEE